MTEYNRDTNPYPCSGKKYNGEKAIISLTSWKARIGTVHKTIANLLGMCTGFHIVLCLSEEEFPKKEAELPDNLMRFVNADLIELLWVYKNYKSFKKILFTMDKYRDVPIISADDDCLYQLNYAEELYQKWSVSNNKIICNNPGNNYGYKWPNGPYSLYPPFCFKENAIMFLKYDEILKTNNDDAYYGVLLTKMKIQIEGIHRKKIIFFHDNFNGLGDGPNRYNAIKDFKTIGNIIK